MCDTCFYILYVYSYDYMPLSVKPSCRTFDRSININFIPKYKNITSNSKLYTLKYKIYENIIGMNTYNRGVGVFCRNEFK